MPEGVAVGAVQSPVRAREHVGRAGHRPAPEQAGAAQLRVDPGHRRHPADVGRVGHEVAADDLPLEVLGALVVAGVVAEHAARPDPVPLHPRGHNRAVRLGAEHVPAARIRLGREPDELAVLAAGQDDVLMAGKAALDVPDELRDVPRRPFHDLRRVAERPVGRERHGRRRRGHGLEGPELRDAAIDRPRRGVPRVAAARLRRLVPEAPIPRDPGVEARRREMLGEEVGRPELVVRLEAARVGDQRGRRHRDAELPAATQPVAGVDARADVLEGVDLDDPAGSRSEVKVEARDAAHGRATERPRLIGGPPPPPPAPARPPA